MPDPGLNLNIWVAGAIMTSIPLKSARQVEAGERVSQGERDADVFILIESEPRKV